MAKEAAEQDFSYKARHPDVEPDESISSAKPDVEKPNAAEEESVEAQAEEEAVVQQEAPVEPEAEPVQEEVLPDYILCKFYKLFIRAIFLQFFVSCHVTSG